jgi:hypothetical protein
MAGWSSTRRTSRTSIAWITRLFLSASNLLQEDGQEAQPVVAVVAGDVRAAGRDEQRTRL